MRTGDELDGVHVVEAVLLEEVKVLGGKVQLGEPGLDLLLLVLTLLQLHRFLLSAVLLFVVRLLGSPRRP
jgi:hypothetical protein